METAERVAGIIAALKEEYPDPVCALQYRKDYELMIAVRLSAQCTDARVNLVTPALFARYPTLDAFAEADVAEVETYVHSCGFYKHKAEDIVLACRMLRDEYGGKVPDKMDDLLRLPGVGRKMAQRFAFYVLDLPEDKAKEFSSAILEAKSKISDSEVLYAAKEKARKIIADAEDRSRQLCQVANEYAEDALARTEEAVQAALTEVKQSRSAFRAASAAKLQEQREKLEAERKTAEEAGN